ncbi:CBS domain-containing protein [Sphingomonas lacusdianchii]|uniref:CBS domain-containing protein n=1 Tax=Sphingomonas lacusdianchii TaxID=2917992 RepID=UPI001F58BA3D|nr:CBS domain-containing protein [Sphingomonas sp. JXJ CY 53]
MTIAKLLGKRAIVSVGADARVRDVVALLDEHRIGAVPVLEGTRVVGIFSERDMIHTLVERGAAALDLPVGDRMTSPAITVDPGASVLGALSLMTQRRIRHLPVIDGERLVGFVSIGDLVKYRIDGIEAEAEAMRAYIQQG